MAVGVVREIYEAIWLYCEDAKREVVGECREVWVILERRIDVDYENKA